MERCSMDAREIETLASYPTRSFAKGEFLFHQGDEATHIFYLAKGTAVRNNYTVRGDELTYGERTANKSASCLLGALSFYTRHHIHETNFVAKTACTCHVLSEGEFKAFLLDNPLVLEDLIYLAMRNYSDLNASFRGKMKGLASARVATYLLDHSLATDDGCLLDTRLNVSEIARELGMHRITVGKIIRALADKGCIAYRDNTIEVVSVSMLREYEDGIRTLDYQHA